MRVVVAAVVAVADAVVAVAGVVAAEVMAAAMAMAWDSSLLSCAVATGAGVMAGRSALTDI